MESSTATDELGALALVCLGAPDRDDLLRTALPGVAGLLGGATVMVLRRLADGLRVEAHHGPALEVRSLDDESLGHSSDGWIELSVPPTWADAGIHRAGAHRLPAPDESLLVAWTGEPSTVSVSPVVHLLASALARFDAEERWADLVTRVDSAQQLADMGDYDWHISSDTNRWSDQLYRIYGFEPHSFHPSYERFLSLIHPDDRERISGVHQRAYATGEPYQMIERIVRPDGEIRYLSSNGQVLMDAEGTPVRMRGTCIDITEQVLAEQERERSAARFRGLVEASPDAIVVVGGDGTVVQTNSRAVDLVGGELVGLRLDALLPVEVIEQGGATVTATGVDGRALTLDVVPAELQGLRDERLRAVFLHDSGPRLRGEALAAGFREAQIRRRQALEINDNIVQGLTAAVYSKDAGSPGTSQRYLERTLAAARRMMNDLLDPLDGQDFQPGDLVRSHASSLGDEPAVAQEAEPAAPGAGAPSCRVLVVDDYDDVRMLLRMKLEGLGYDVVGEAADGHEAVHLATTHRPDLVLLDVAMPRMDGLEALPLIREAVEGVKVVVLSGFDQGAMAEKALAAGASRYVEKGHALADLMQVLGEVLEE